MKKLIILLNFILCLSSFSTEEYYNIQKCSLEKDKIKLKKYTLESKDFIVKSLNRPNRKIINKAFKSIKNVENLINHITDDHYRDIKKEDIITLSKTKLELYEIKNELFLLRKTLVE